MCLYIYILLDWTGYQFEIPGESFSLPPSHPRPVVTIRETINFVWNCSRLSLKITLYTQPSVQFDAAVIRETGVRFPLVRLVRSVLSFDLTITVRGLFIIFFSHVAFIDQTYISRPKLRSNFRSPTVGSSTREPVIVSAMPSKHFIVPGMRRKKCN